MRCAISLSEFIGTNRRYPAAWTAVSSVFSNGSDESESSVVSITDPPVSV